mgnify:CR=1 FL=1
MIHSSWRSPATGEALPSLLDQLNGWVVEEGKLVKLHRFANYYETLAFVNALAWIAHREDHHPEMYVTYNSCKVEFATHSVDGLSRNDFICAAKVDALDFPA